MTTFGKYLLGVMHTGLLLVVLAGVLTWLFAERGELVLTMESHPAVMTDDGDIRLPSGLSLAGMSVDAGSCRLVSENGCGFVVSPNHPALFGHFLICVEEVSSAYVSLIVVDDPWGFSLAIVGLLMVIVASAILLGRHIREWHIRPEWWQTGIFGLLLLLMIGMLQPSDPQLPVLRTPWLLIHLLPLVLAYTLLSVSLVFAVIIISGRWGKTLMTCLPKLLEAVTLLLGIGIALGALWACVSWGRYWGWDIKETWALIAYVVSAIPLHFKSLNDFTRHPYALAIWTVVIVAIVIATYVTLNPFGLRSLHSY